MKMQINYEVQKNLKKSKHPSLREKCPNEELFLVRIFPHLNYMRRNMKYLSVFSPNAGKYRPEKTLYLDTFHVVNVLLDWNASFTKDWSNFEFDWEYFKCPINWCGHIVKNRGNSVLITLHEKWSFPFTISSVNVT